MTTGTIKPFVAALERPATVSMSFIRAAEGCLRRAHLDRAARVPSGGDALIGSVFHEVEATIGFVCVMRGVPGLSVDDALSVARRVLRRPERPGPLPRDAYRSVLKLTERWARYRTQAFRPGELFEVASTRPLDGWTLSARMDRVWRDDAATEIRDLKTGWGDVGTSLTVQGEVYAWHEFESRPGCEVVTYWEDHVRFGVPNGPWELTREDVYGSGGIDEFLRDALARLRAAYDSGELPASPGSACESPSRCPHAQSCPVPEEYRPGTTVQTATEAAELFAAMLVLEARRGAMSKQARGYLVSAGDRAIQLGGEEIGWAAKPGSKLDRKALAADIEAGALIGDLDAYSVTTNPTFGRRKASS